jgi:hypothetical protein
MEDREGAKLPKQRLGAPTSPIVYWDVTTLPASILKYPSYLVHFPGGAPIKG